MAMIETTLSVPDISCEHCVKTINGALAEVTGVGDVSVSIPAKTVHLAYDPAKVTLEHIEEVLDEEGYAVAK
ncbi:MAG TPA: cation transporter [Ktedonobacterales bacterium]